MVGIPNKAWLGEAISGDAPERVRILDHDPLTPYIDTKKRQIPEAEDTVLSNYLQAVFDEIYTSSEEPPRFCPHCRSGATALRQRPQTDRPNRMLFECYDCRSIFTRATGTPFARARINKIDLPLFFKLLAQYKTVTSAASILGVKAFTLTNWIKRVREWLLVLDPSGSMESRIRLGMIAAPDLACPNPECGSQSELVYRGFSSDTGGRICFCYACCKYVSLSALRESLPEDTRMGHHLVKRRRAT
ncbi:DUF746 domain-containing protein [Brucella sp. HL-2]|nr:DUF746 domain-containing protein [Brucella sp. HL-2]MCV9909539.1 DUF746 domain-containing protein [Brucella sp. HL-2]